MNRWRRWLLARRAFLSFGLVGGIGFVVDATLLMLLFELLQLDLALARIIAFLCAASSNWFLNRSITFADRLSHSRKSTEWARFVTSAILSAIPNLGIFFLLMHFLPETRASIIFAMCCGILAGYLCNYQLARQWVFKARPVDYQEPNR